MSVKMILCFIILALFACTSVLFDILFRWCDEFIAFVKRDKFDLSISFAPRGTGEENSLRGWK